jgi:hypothetical protein
MLFSNDGLLPAGNALSSSLRRSLEAENSDRFEVFTESLIPVPEVRRPLPESQTLDQCSPLQTSGP